METTKTRVELVTMAADELGVTSDGAALEAEDSTKIDGRLDGLLLELSARGVVSVSADDDEIPAEYCGPLSELLANEAAPAFGIPRKPIPERTAIEDRLKLIDQRQPPSKPLLQVDKMFSGNGGALTYSRWSSGR